MIHLTNIYHSSDVTTQIICIRKYFLKLYKTLRKFLNLFN